MNDHLTYKIAEVCGMQLSSFYIDCAAEILCKLGEFINKSLSDILYSLQCYFADSEEEYQIECRRKQLRAIKVIKPTHKAPVYKIIPYVRNRC